MLSEPVEVLIREGVQQRIDADTSQRRALVVDHAKLRVEPVRRLRILPRSQPMHQHVTSCFDPPDQSLSHRQQRLGRRRRADDETVFVQVELPQTARHVLDLQADLSQLLADAVDLTMERRLLAAGRVVGRILQHVPQKHPRDRLDAQLREHLHLAQDVRAVAVRYDHQRRMADARRGAGDDHRNARACRGPGRLPVGNGMAVDPLDTVARHGARQLHHGGPVLEVLRTHATQQRVVGYLREGHGRGVVCELDRHVAPIVSVLLDEDGSPARRHPVGQPGLAEVGLADDDTLVRRASIAAGRNNQHVQAGRNRRGVLDPLEALVRRVALGELAEVAHPNALPLDRLSLGEREDAHRMPVGEHGLPRHVDFHRVGAVGALRHGVAVLQAEAHLPVFTRSQRHRLLLLPDRLAVELRPEAEGELLIGKGVAEHVEESG